MASQPEEKVYLEEYDVKVTNLRFCHHRETVPIDWISETYVHHRVIRMTLSVFGFIGSLYSLTYGLNGLLIIAIFFIWLSYEYTHYVELFITVNGKRQRIKYGSIAGSRYIYNIEDALILAIEESKKLKDSGGFDYTESIKFSIKMKELEH